MADAVAGLLAKVETPIGAAVRKPCKHCRKRGYFDQRDGSREVCTQCNGYKYVYAIERVGA